MSDHKNLLQKVLRQSEQSNNTNNLRFALHLQNSCVTK